MSSSKIVYVNQRAANRARHGHPWIFKSDIVGVELAEPGDVVSVQEKVPLNPNIVKKKKTFLGQALFNPDSQISLRFLTRPEQDEEVNASFWKERFAQAIQRRDFLKRDARRLIFGESDLCPAFVLDQYAKVVVFQSLSRCLEPFRETFLNIIEELLSPAAIVERNDVPVRALEGLVLQKGVVRGALPPNVEIHEGDVSLSADVLEGQKTGLFLDQYDNHVSIKPYISGKVLDLFTYQGGFALQAASVADEVIAVDSSGPALKVLQENAARNQIKNVRCEEANVFDLLKELDQSGEKFDTVILDPPPFARQKKKLGNALRGYKEIHLRAMKLLRPEGILITSSCSQNFTRPLFEEVLSDAARDTRKQLQVLEVRGASPDHPVLLTFPESDYLHHFVLRQL